MRIKKRIQNALIFIAFCLAYISTIKIGILTLELRFLDTIIEKAHLQPDGIKLDANKMKEIMEFGTYISETYIEWLEKSGMTGTPINLNLDDTEILLKLEKYDGLLLTGGSEEFYKKISNIKHITIPSDYLRKVSLIIKHVKEINDQIKNFPVFAICLGFEAVLLSESNFSLLRHEVYNELLAPTPIMIRNAMSQASSFFTTNELETMEKLSITYFNHKFGIYSNEVLLNQMLKDKIEIIAVFPKDDQELVAWYEYKDYPIVAVQFHPEKFAKFSESNPDTLEYKQFSINKKFAQLFKSLVVNPKPYRNNNRTENFILDNKTRFQPVTSYTRYKGKSLVDQNENHYIFSHVGMYEKIEVFVHQKNSESRL